MKIYLEYEAEECLGFAYEELACTVGDAVLKQEGFSWEAEVNLVLTTDGEIRQANREFRKIDAPTDVLSFPAIPFGAPGDYQEMLSHETLYKNPDSGNIMLGDIMISVPRVLSQADAYGHDAKREYAFLIAHSMLHLLGYDHMEPGQAREMEEKQENVLENLGIMRNV